MKQYRKARRRRYDSSGRQEAALRTREAVLAAAKSSFRSSGYAATTISAIAGAAGVSVETVYKAFGGKPGLVRALYERAQEGQGSRPAPARSDALSAKERDPRVIVRGWGGFVAEVSPLVSPLLLLVRAAAGDDDELKQVLAEADAQRLERMRHNARVLAKRGFLRKGLTIERAAQIMWAHTSPEFYDLYVLRLGWTPQQLGELVGESMSALLL